MKNELMEKILERIGKAESILIAIAKNPTVDELATAIGLEMYLDKIGKRATAIYSGITPNTLEFLKPEEKFDTDTNGLQDFIIAINKDKADHLRYKLDGEFVKVFITPYKSRIKQEDLEFSYGEFNVDLVIALNVRSVDDLDAALMEYGRILHDASVVNITTEKQGGFGEVVWAEQSASSVGEMVSRLVFSMKEKSEMDKDVATAFLTGVVAATDRFSNEKTRPETMAVAAKLMAAGADQQLVSINMEKEENRAVENVDLAQNMGATGEVRMGNNVGIAENTGVAEINFRENNFSETKLPTVQMPNMGVAEAKMPIVQAPVTENMPATENVEEVSGEMEIPEEKKGPGIQEVNYNSVIDNVLGNEPKDDFDRTVEISDQVSVPEKTSYLNDAEMKIVQPVSEVREEDVIVQPEVALPMPGDEILPPPPTPPVQF